MSQHPEQKKTQSTFKAALLFGSGTLTSRILGLFRVFLVYSIMPLDMRDAWIAAFRIPNFFRRLLGEGGLSVSFIPIYVAALKKGDEKRRKALAHGVFSLLMSVVSLVCLICFFFMESIIESWLAGPGFAAVPGKIEMTVAMGRVMIFFLFFVCLFAFFMAILNAHKKFTMSGYAPLFLNLGIIVGLLLFKDSEHLQSAAAWAVVIGVSLQALFLLYPIVKIGELPKFTFHFLTPEVTQVLKKFVPTFLGVGVLQVLGLINTYFASQLHPGALSHIDLGDRLLELPMSLIAVSIGTTLLPTLSGFWSTGDKEEFRDCLLKHFRLFYFLALPSAFGLWFIGTDIVGVLFRHGEFLADEVSIVATILKIYCLTLMASGSMKIFNQAYYSMGDTKTPAFIALFGLVVHLFMAPLLMEQMGLNGLILSTASVSLLNLLVGVFILQARIGWLPWLKIAKHFSMCLVAGGAMGGFLFALSQFDWRQGRFILDFPLLVFFIGIAGVIYFAFGLIFRLDELNFVLRKLRRK